VYVPCSPYAVSPGLLMTALPVVYFHNGIQDVRWVLLTCVFDLFGGGLPMREILLYLYVAESVPGEGM
jgi:hypothetical protein